MVVLLFELTTKDAMFLWNPNYQNVFNMLKDALVRAPILLKPNFTKLKLFGVGANLSQKKEEMNKL